MTPALDALLAQIDRLDPPAGRIGTPPDDGLIALYEAQTGLAFPEDYRLLLKRAGNAFVGTLDLLTLQEPKGSVRGELRAALEVARAAGVPPDWLPISEDNGDYHCLTPDGSVRFRDHNGASAERWPSLADWIAEVWLAGV